MDSNSLRLGAERLFRSQSSSFWERHIVTSILFSMAMPNGCCSQPLAKPGFGGIVLVCTLSFGRNLLRWLFASGSVIKRPPSASDCDPDCTTAPHRIDYRCQRIWAASSGTATPEWWGITRAV